MLTPLLIEPSIMSHKFHGIFCIVTFFVLYTKSQNCGPTPQVLPETCCAIPQFFDDSDLVKCKNLRNVRSKRFATSRMELGTCYLDCVFESTNVTFAGGRVLNTNNLLVILLKATPNEPQANQVITNAVGKCVNDLNTGVMTIRNPTISNCSTIPSAIMLCIHKYFFFNCPSNRFQNIAQCFQLKDYLQRCAVSI